MFKVDTNIATIFYQSIIPKEIAASFACWDLQRKGVNLPLKNDLHPPFQDEWQKKNVVQSNKNLMTFSKVHFVIHNLIPTFFSKKTWDLYTSGGLQEHNVYM